jgi:RNA polymerase sigma-70 factor (ECF subfamily)
MSRSRREIYDELLIIRCRRGDGSAWNELVERWNDRLYYYLRRLIDNEADAANALQEVWYQAFRGLRKLKDDARLSAWLYTITRRIAVNHYRQEASRHESNRGEMPAPATSDEEDPEIQFDNAELVHFGLSQLDLPEREVLTLYFLEDLSTAEMAEVIGVPVGTVKSRLFKARRTMKAILEREVNQHER